MGAGAFTNVIIPYTKNQDIFGCPSTETVEVYSAAVTAAQVKKPTENTYTYNGLLHTSPAAAVISPADVVLVWEGNGKVKTLGNVFANPTLSCPNANQPCIFVPTTDGTCGGGINGGISNLYTATGSSWVHSEGANMTFADGHVKWRKLGAQHNAAKSLTTDCHADPSTGYDDQGFGSVYWNQAGPNGEQWPCHTYMFRPDYQPTDKCW